mmetsp:Transcript_9546/g.21456  ORF Transcript_9546/g.21456 Transcript_9546/m.21456 type:complete len:223 (-) Transcript_9546:1313-1981(-)
MWSRRCSSWRSSAGPRTRAPSTQTWPQSGPGPALCTSSRPRLPPRSAGRAMPLWSITRPWMRPSAARRSRRTSCIGCSTTKTTPSEPRVRVGRWGRRSCLVWRRRSLCFQTYPGFAPPLPPRTLSPACSAHVRHGRRRGRAGLCCRSPPQRRCPTKGGGRVRCLGGRGEMPSSCFCSGCWAPRWPTSSRPQPPAPAPASAAASAAKVASLVLALGSGGLPPK